MKSYEETIRSVHRKMSLYDAEQKQKRAKYRQIAAAVMPVFAMAAAGTALWKSGAFKPAEIQQICDVPVIRAAETGPRCTAAAQTTKAALTAVPEEAPQASAAVRQPVTEPIPEGSAAETAPPEQAQPAETASESSAAAAQSVTASEPEAARTTAAVPGGNGPCLRDGDEPPVYRNLITSYPVSGSGDYRAPYDGEVCYTVPLFYAMKEYGADENTDFLVIIDLYGNNGEKRLMEYADLKAEWERLGALGYKAGLNQPGDAAPFLTLHATYGELQSFPAEADRGYFLRLYQEDGGSCFPAVFNGGCQEGSSFVRP